MATVYFFNGTQSGTADGSYADPYDLTQLATQESASSAGDVFIFKDGTYSNTSRTFTGGAGISYKAESDRGVVFNGGTFLFGTSTGGTVDFNIDGIDFIDLNFTSNSIEIKMAKSAGTSVTCNRCVFKSNSLSTSGANGFIGMITVNTALRMSAVFNQCVFKAQTTGSGAEFFRNRYTGEGILQLNGCSISHSVGGASVFFSGIGSGFVKNTIIYGASSNITKGTIPSESYNCYYNIGESADPANNIIVDDPQFVDQANGDFRLRPTSPCINAGTAS